MLLICCVFWEFGEHSGADVTSSLGQEDYEPFILINPVLKQTRQAHVKNTRKNNKNLTTDFHKAKGFIIFLFL